MVESREENNGDVWTYTRLCMYLDDVTTIYFSQNRLYSIHVDNNGVCIHPMLLIAMLTGYMKRRINQHYASPQSLDGMHAHNDLDYREAKCVIPR